MPINRLKEIIQAHKKIKEELEKKYEEIKMREMMQKIKRGAGK